MTETITCARCPNTFPWEVAELDPTWIDMLRPTLCDDCEKLEVAAEKGRRDAERERSLQNARESTAGIVSHGLPSRYSETNLGHPAFKRSTWERMMRWRPSKEKPWLGLHGETGTCKTRLACLMLRDIVIESTWRHSDFEHRHSSFQFASHTQLAAWIRDQYEDKAGEVKKQLAAARSCTVLLLDDLGKAKPTPAVTAQIFDLLDYRHAENMTTIWTANSTPEEIVAGMPADVAAPLAGRLNECSTIIKLR
jgi:DNA replication protein DnaC